MSMNWTKEQMQVITLRDRNILVSAAAGSGKTAVLVERILGRILDEKNPVDIDRMLIVTFTSAAAAEMRGRIGRAVDDALARDPGNTHLMRQATLVHHAQITTIHSFCLHLIREYFHQVDLEPNFRMAEEGELSLLMEDAAAEILNRNYEAASAEFLWFAECFSAGKKDDALKSLIETLFRFAMSHPWPMEWLSKAAQAYCFDNFSDLERAPWMQSLLAYLRDVLGDLQAMAQENQMLSNEPDGPDYLAETAQRDGMLLRQLAQAKDYRSMAQQMRMQAFDRLPTKRGYDGDAGKLALFKERRNEIRDTVKKLKEKYFFAEEEEMFRRLSAMAPAAKELVRLTEEFLAEYDAKKREKNILDFNDLEHFALKILIDEETKEPTEAAASCRKLFCEIMIDEYQDSNLVQEMLLWAVSGESEGRNNRFMVGDVKQSIYRFRLARPELFMEKYETYTAEDSPLQKIELRKNFRSRREVLETANRIFGQIMKKDLGRIEYDENAALYEGAIYPECKGMEAELIVANCENKDGIRLEAEITAAKIRQMMRDQKVTDAATGELRSMKYSDIVILMRSFTGYADTFLEVFEEKKIPAHASAKTGYFQALEIRTVLALLRILDNPRQDIALTAVLRSPIFGFSDEELATLRAAGTKKAFHCCILEPKWDGLPEGLSLKLKRFLEDLSSYRDLAAELSVHELLYRLLEETGYARYAAALPSGERRRANLEMLLEKAAAYETTSYRGLFHFIRYIDRLNQYEVDYGEAELVSENANAVRIMTIHKSKGLEFPVVFLCGTAKRFNRMDERSTMVVHPDFGAAFDYIDPIRRIRGATLYKRAAANRIALENQGEELRVLYVAMTRAKEKLVITGVRQKIQESLETLAQCFHGQREVSFFRRAGANSFLDLLLPAIFANGDEKIIHIWEEGDFVKEEAESRMEGERGLAALLLRMAQPDAEMDAFVQEQLSYRYPYEADISRKMNYSVSELKSRAARAVWEEGEIFAEAEEVIPYIPRFAGGQAAAGEGVLRGTAMHRAMQLLPVAFLAGNKMLKYTLLKEVERLVASGKLNEEMRQLLQLDKLERFYSSDLALRMKAAAERKELYMEQPFVLGRSADEIESDKSDALVLIQGIVDVFFIEDGEIVLLDYKTDAVKSARVLTDRYRTQLEWYQKALEANFKKRVKEKIIYSFCLNEAILIYTGEH